MRITTPLLTLVALCCGIAPAGPAPASASLPAPACSEPNHDAIVVHAAVPDYPDAAYDVNLGPVATQVVVEIGPDGKLSDAEIQRSSGIDTIDQAALQAAKASTYSPKIVNCGAVAGKYLFRTVFIPANGSGRCDTPDMASAITKQVAPVYPTSARKLGLGAMTVNVKVVVSAYGDPTVSVDKSSGNADIDEAAVEAAAASSYSGKLIHCQAAGDEFVVPIRVDPATPNPLATPGGR